MNSNYLKNIDFETPLALKELVSCQPGQVVSRTLAQNKAVSITLFAFDKGEEISSHRSEGDAMVVLFEGTAEITIGDNTFTAGEGQTIVMPAGIPHALKAVTPFKMLLTVVFKTE